MKTLDRAPVFQLALFFILGILGGAQTNVCATAGLAIAIPGFIWLHLREKKHYSFSLERIRSLLIGLIFFSCGAGLIEVSQYEFVSPNLEKINCRESIFAGNIVSPIKQNQYGQRGVVEVYAFWNPDQCQWENILGKTQFFIKPKDFQEVHLQDSIVFRAWLTNAYSRSQGYLSYLHRQDIYHSAYVKELEVIGRENRLTDYPRLWQNKLSTQLTGLFQDSTALAIAQAMLLGDKSQMDKEVKKQFAVAGLSHILAISGLHVGIVFGLLTFLLSPIYFIKHGHRLKSLVILVSLVIYMLITGASPAVVRAVIMLSIVLLFKLFYQRFHILNVIAVAAFLQLIFRPEILFQVGFQLSYAAVLGIILIFPMVERFSSSQHIILKPLISWIGITIAASVATFPLVWYYFGQFPTYFVISNILTSFLVTVLVFCGFLTVMFAFVPGVNAFLAELTETLIQLLIWIVEQLNDLPYALIETDHIELAPILIVLAQLSLVLLMKLGSYFLNPVDQK